MYLLVNAFTFSTQESLMDAYILVSDNISYEIPLDF